jgi:predicted peroxiredoxin
MAKKKFLIIIQAGPQDMGRALHGLTYGQELHEGGHEVEIFFDGTGTKWITEFGGKEHPFHPVFKSVMALGILKGACGYCTSFFKLEDKVSKAGIPLKDGAKDGHLSLSEHIDNGFELLVM